MATLGLPASAGVPKSSVADTVVVPYNVVPEIGGDVACVIVEPVAANMGLVAPAPGFLEGLRVACDRAGALLIFDEVITGFRIARGGATEFTGVRPDLWTFGKVIGGGLPLAAFAGRRDVMESLAPLGPVYQAGTLSGNPLSTAAGLTVLSLLDDAAYTMLAGRAAELGPMLAAVLNEVTPVQVPVVGPLVGLFFSDAPVTDYTAAKVSAETGWYPRFFRSMLERGIAFAPGAYEAMFPSLAHTWDDIERTTDLARAAISTVRFT
jgi:glutamate-1-semialdehyde 2,1-aminomutase